MRQWLCSALYTVFMVASGIVAATLIALSFWRRPEQKFSMVRTWARMNMWVLARLCGLTYVVEGAENVPDRAAVVLQKHSSAWETIAGIIYYPTHTWVLKRELMWVPLLGWALAALNAVPINRQGRGQAVQQVIERGAERLRAGINVMIYPEGTRVALGETRRFGRSGALLAVNAGAPVVPIAHNAAEFWPRRATLKRPGTVRVCIGPPIETAGRSSEEVTAEAKAWIEATMARISPAHAARAATDAGRPASAG